VNSPLIPYPRKSTQSDLHRQFGIVTPPVVSGVLAGRRDLFQKAGIVNWRLCETLPSWPFCESQHQHGSALGQRRSSATSTRQSSPALKVILRPTLKSGSRSASTAGWNSTVPICDLVKICDDPDLNDMTKPWSLVRISRIWLRPLRLSRVQWRRPAQRHGAVQSSLHLAGLSRNDRKIVLLRGCVRC